MLVKNSCDTAVTLTAVVILTTLHQWTAAKVMSGNNDQMPNITISCPNSKAGEHCSFVKFATEYELKLVCHVSDQYAIASIHWLHYNGTDINDLGLDRMHYDSTTNTSSTLTISSTKLEDSGNYTCFTSLPGLSTQIEVQTYVMPDYLVAGIVLLCVNLALCILFAACLTLSVIKQRRLKQHKTNSKQSESLQKHSSQET